MPTVISRPTQPWGYVIPLGTKTYPGPLNRRRAGAPVLDFNFAEDRSLVDRVSGDSLVTFTRASTGTYWDSSGNIQTAAVNEPRFSYNPLTGQSLGLLIEEARTNICQNPVLTTGSGWTTLTNGTMTATAGSRGVGTWYTVTENSASGTRFIGRTESFVSGTTYTLSMFVQAVPGAPKRWSGFVWAGAAFNGGVAIFTSVDPDTGEFWSSAAGPTGGRVDLGNGLIRVWSTFTATATAASAPQFRMYASLSQGSAFHIGANADTVRLAQPQYEAGATMSSYIYALDASATRAADVATISGANFTSWFNPLQGTFLAKFRRSFLATGNLFAVGDGAVTETMRLITIISTGVRPRWQIVDGNVTQANIVAIASVSADALGQAACSYALNDFGLATNGVLAARDVAGTLPTVSSLVLGSNAASSGDYHNGHLASLTYWDESKDDTFLTDQTS